MPKTFASLLEKIKFFSAYTKMDNLAHVGMGEFIYGSYNLNSGVKVESIHGWLEYVYGRYYGLHSIQGSTLVGSGNSFGSTIKYSELEQ